MNIRKCVMAHHRGRSAWNSLCEPESSQQFGASSVYQADPGLLSCNASELSFDLVGCDGCGYLACTLANLQDWVRMTQNS